MIEAYLSLSLACFLGLASITEDFGEGDGWRRFNSFLSIFLLFFILIVPVWMYRIISKNYEQLSEKSFFIKYNELYECLDFQKKRDPLFYIPLLFTKRFLIAFSIVILRQNLAL